MTRQKLDRTAPLVDAAPRTRGNATRRTLAATAVALVATAAVAGAAFAGSRSPNPVQVNLTAQLASGGLGNARNSPDSTQYIQCYVSSTASVVYLACLARTADSVIGACSKVNPSAALLEPLRSMTSDSVIHFQWDASGSCTNVSILNASTAEPKQ